MYIKNGSFDGYEYAEVFLVSLMYSLENNIEKEKIFDEVEKRFINLDKLNLKREELIRLMLYFSAKRYGKRTLDDNREPYQKIAKCLYKKFYDGEID
ncbi:hypothetical protein AD998_09985 [bacterium 336/3]|nr:hypothetical protein AD998_09985 [bacterium 336/3]